MEKDRYADKRFYQPRLKVLRDIVRDLQSLSDGKLMRLGLSMPLGTGKSTLGIFYITWLMGRELLKPSLATAYADDMVSGSEEAMNRETMDILWTKFCNDFMSHMKQDCKMLIIGTRWSIHDPIGRLEQRYGDGKKSKFVKLPALDFHGRSNFDYDYGDGFSTDYFYDLKENMDDISWRAIYMQEPIERE